MMPNIMPRWDDSKLESRQSWEDRKKPAPKLKLLQAFMTTATFVFKEPIEPSLIPGYA